MPDERSSAPRRSSASAASRSSFDPGKTTTGIAREALGHCAELDLVALDQRVRQELLAHSLELRLRLVAIVGRELDVDEPADPRVATSNPRWRSELSTA